MLHHQRQHQHKLLELNRHGLYRSQLEQTWLLGQLDYTVDDRTGKSYSFTKQSKPYSLDLVLQPPVKGTSSIPTTSIGNNGTVLAVWSLCEVVLVDYGNGWWVEYIHMANIPVTSGNTVNTNSIIGYPTTNIPPKKPCGNVVSTAEHVHFAFLNGSDTTRKGAFVPMQGRVLCGHAVQSNGSLQGLGLTFTVPACPGSVHNGNIWVTGHDADYHCSNEGNQCNYLQVAVNYVVNGSTLPILALDHGTQVATAITDAFGSAAPTVDTVDPRTAFSSTQLVDSSGNPLYSAIIVASDTTCGGCDNNDGFGVTPDSDAVNARSLAIIQFYSDGGGILALAGAENINVFYIFLPLAATGIATTSPYTFTSLGLSLGLIEGTDDNCCATHNSFDLPGSGSDSSFQVVETDAAGLAETMIINGTGGASAKNWVRPTRSSQKPSVPQNK